MASEERSAMHVRTTTPADLDRVMEIYATARAFMAANGNPNQWGPTNWPPRSLIEQDIAQGKHHVCEQDGRVVAAFYFDCGPHVDPCYDVIDDGAWIGCETYGVVHRIASDGSVPGAGSACIRWAYARCGHLRIDTHADNAPMQRLLTKLGFVRCGIIYVYEDHFPRIAYELV